MNTSSISPFKCLRCSLNIRANCPRQATNTAVGDGIGYSLHCLKITRTRDSETSLNHIDTQFFERLGDTNFFLFGHRSAWALLTVAQCGIKNN